MVTGMEVGTAFLSWDNFSHALERYSKENKVTYVVGTCKSVETANKNNALHSKFPVRFKYCFARMVCKHGNYHSQNAVSKPNQNTCKSVCTSSVLVSVNKKRTALVVKEANFIHTHDKSESVFNKYSPNPRLQGEERRMASVLLRAGVPLSRVQEFISKVCTKAPSIKDLQDIKSGLKVESLEFEFLNDLDSVMSEDPESIVNIINFDLVPGAIYIQTHDMTQRMNGSKCNQLQMVTHPINGGKYSVINMLMVDVDLNPHILAFCIVIVGAKITFQYFMETFVRNNSEFCDSLHGIVLDCSKENADFVQELIPQADLAWSRSYIVEKFIEETQGSDTEFQTNLQMRKDLMNATSEVVYEEKLKEFFESLSTLASKQFLRTWDSCKELWVQYEISSCEGLYHQKSAVEMDYINSLNAYVKSSITLSHLIKALMKFLKDDGKYDMEKLAVALNLDPSFEKYCCLCFPEAAQAINLQLVIACNSVYDISQKTDMIFVKRRDTDDEFILEKSGNKCTCRYFMDSELPCQHIFACMKFLNKPLYNESLIPERWQVFGKSLTLDALAESLAQGHVPSSMQHDERLRELQTIGKDILSACSTHSYQQMGNDLVLLKQILSVMKSCQSHITKVVSTYSKVSITEQHEPLVTPAPRRRGRPSKKDKLLQVQQVQASLSPSKAPVVSPVISRHNLRTNIKHKFVTRDSYPEGVSKLDVQDNKMGEDNNESSVVSKLEAGINKGQTDSAKAEEVTTVADEDEPEVANVSLCEQVKNEISPETSDDQLLAVQVRGHPHDYKQGLREGYKVSSSRRGRSPFTISSHQSTYKRSHSEMLGSSSESENSSEGDYDEEVEEVDAEKLEVKRVKMKKQLDSYFEQFSDDCMKEVIHVVSTLESTADRAQRSFTDLSTTAPQCPADVLLHSCQEDSEMIDYIVELLQRKIPGHETYSYRVAACIVCRSINAGALPSEIIQTVSEWPSHLPDQPTARPSEDEIALHQGQCLNVCGHKLDSADVGSLQPGKEPSSKIIHAYLEVLAQKHSGKMFVIPFEVIYLWRQGSYSDKIFKKVHFKTFEYLVLPINCGAEFTEMERQGVDMPTPYWMALVADIRNKTVSMLNPRHEDKYSIAANGYMLQWRRYMQIRCVHTGEMMSSWTTRTIHCTRQVKERTSGVLLLMNIEALINGVPPIVMTEAHIPRYLTFIALTLRNMDRETTVLCVGGPDCQQLAAQDADWLQCENCRTWWHRACAGHDHRLHTFYCTSCQQRIQVAGERRSISQTQNQVAEEDCVVEEGENQLEDEVEEEEEDEEEMDEDQENDEAAEDI